MKSLGLIEVVGLTNAIFVADAMVKTSNIDVNDVEITKGFGYVTVKVTGDVGAVNAAIAAGRSIAMEIDKLVSVKVIARPHGDTATAFVEEKKEKKVEKKETKPATKASAKKVATKKPTAKKNSTNAKKQTSTAKNTSTTKTKKPVKKATKPAVEIKPKTEAKPKVETKPEVKDTAKAKVEVKTEAKPKPEIKLPEKAVTKQAETKVKENEKE